MGLDIGGYDQKPDWSKMGLSLLIASCLILAIRTAKWPSRSSGGTARVHELDVEVEHAIHLAGRVLSHLVSSRKSAVALAYWASALTEATSVAVDLRLGSTT